MRRDGGEPEGVVANPQALEVSASTQLLAKRIGDYLERTYPGWGWMIQPDEWGGVFTIRSARLHGTWGWLVHTEKIQDDPALKLVKQAAGELLERFGMPRKPFRLCVDVWREAPRAIDGQLIPDLMDKSARRRAGSRARAVERALATGTAKIVEVVDTWTGERKRVVSVPREIVT